MNVEDTILGRMWYFNYSDLEFEQEIIQEIKIIRDLEEDLK